MSRGATWLLCGVIVAAACSQSVPEPSDAQIRALLDEHRAVLDELRQLFEEDVKRRDLTTVRARAAFQSRFADRKGEACLPADRWREYALRLNRAGIQRIERHETPGIYFHIYDSRFWRDGFRYRGLVFAPGSPKVVHDHDDIEHRVDLGEGWYAYLIIDT